VAVAVGVDEEDRDAAGRQRVVVIVDGAVAVVVGAVADLGRAGVDGRVIVVAVEARGVPVAIGVWVGGRRTAVVFVATGHGQ